VKPADGEKVTAGQGPSFNDFKIDANA
jgi:hypothetical protein